MSLIWVIKKWSELVFFKMYCHVRDLHNWVVSYCICSALYIFQTAKGKKQRAQGSGLITFRWCLDQRNICSVKSHFCLVKQSWHKTACKPKPINYLTLVMARMFKKVAQWLNGFDSLWSLIYIKLKIRGTAATYFNNDQK